jgi:hypothetical protein
VKSLEKQKNWDKKGFKSLSAQIAIFLKRKHQFLYALKHGVMGLFKNRRIPNTELQYMRL